MPTHADPAAESLPAQRVRAVCPRCGYDLSGVVESWRESCPLEGVCSECGLGVEWGRVFAGAEPPAWSCEHAVRFSVWKLLKTSWRLMWPPAYWRAITMETPVRAGRLAWMVVGFAVTGYVGLLGLFLCLGFAAVFVRWLRDGRDIPWAGIADDLTTLIPYYPLGLRLGSFYSETIEEFAPLAAVLLVACLALPIGRLAGARHVHAWRRGFMWRALAMVLVGMMAVHAFRMALVFALGFAVSAASQGYAMLFGMVVVPVTCSPYATAALLLFHGLSMWSAYVLVFLRLKRGRGYVWLCWVTGSLLAGGVWWWPWIREYLRTI